MESVADRPSDLARARAEMLLCALVAATASVALVAVSPPGGDTAAHLYRTWLLERGQTVWDHLWFTGHYLLAGYSLLYYPPAALVGNIPLVVAAVVASAALFWAIARGGVGRRRALAGARVRRRRRHAALHRDVQLCRRLRGRARRPPARAAAADPGSPACVPRSRWASARSRSSSSASRWLPSSSCEGGWTARPSCWRPPSGSPPRFSWRSSSCSRPGRATRTTRCRCWACWSSRHSRCRSPCERPARTCSRPSSRCGRSPTSPCSWCRRRSGTTCRGSATCSSRSSCSWSWSRSRAPRTLAAAALAAALIHNVAPDLAAVPKRVADARTAKQAFWDPALDYVRSHGNPGDRVEVVPTFGHWEAWFVARAGFPLARGWYRQIDVVENPELYRAATPADRLPGVAARARRPLGAPAPRAPRPARRRAGRRPARVRPLGAAARLPLAGLARLPRALRAAAPERARPSPRGAARPPAAGRVGRRARALPAAAALHARCGARTAPSAHRGQPTA